MSNTTYPTPSAATLTQNVQELVQQLRGHLHTPDRLQQIADYTNWQRAAENELVSRHTRLLAALSDELLVAIASGQVDIAHTAKTLLK